jgi:hypothetical protein
MPLERADISRLRHRLEAAHAHHREGARRRDGPVRPHVHADAARFRRAATRSSTTSTPARGAAASDVALRRRARRPPGAGRTRLRRRRHRRHGHRAALEGVRRLLLRQHGRQHHPRSDRGHAAARAAHPFIDIDRAGIWGHSGGGFATASAMFRHPDFFKVGVSQAGNHDNRNYVDSWSERFQGLLTRTNGSDSYEAQANQLVAGNLGASCSSPTAPWTTTSRRTTRTWSSTRSSRPTATSTSSSSPTHGTASARTTTT